MIRCRKALLGTMFILGSCFLFMERLSSNDRDEVTLLDLDMRSPNGRNMMTKRNLPLRVRLEAKGFKFQPDLYGYGIRSITLRELCKLLECSSQDFRDSTAQYLRIIEKRPITFDSPDDRYIQRPGKFTCRIWFLDPKHLPVDIEDAKVQAAVSISSDSE